MQSVDIFACYYLDKVDKKKEVREEIVKTIHIRTNDILPHSRQLLSAMHTLFNEAEKMVTRKRPEPFVQARLYCSIDNTRVQLGVYGNAAHRSVPLFRPTSPFLDMFCCQRFGSSVH